MGNEHDTEVEHSELALDLGSEHSVVVEPNSSRLASTRLRLGALPPWARKGLFVLSGATVLLLVASIVGFALNASSQQVAADRLATSEKLEESLTEAKEDLYAANGMVTDLEKEVDTIESRERVVADRQTGLDAREKLVVERETAVQARETAIDAKEKQVEASTFGDGVRVVGTTVQPGTYTTQGGDGSNSVGCYYAWKTGTGSDSDIVDNNIVNGAATVTLRAGEIFESSSCQDWIKVG